MPSTVARCRWRIAAAAALVLLAGTPRLVAAEPAAWLTGPQFDEQRLAPLSLSWSEVPLRQGLANLSRANRIAILLDRRVDPGQPLALALNGVPLGEALGRLADSRQLGLSWLGPLAYIGPRPTAEILRTAAAVRAQEAAALPAASRAALTGKRAWQWPDLASPRDLVARLAAEASLRIEGLERIPHDLWAAADLPPLSLIDRLTLVVIQFDLTFEIGENGRLITLVPLEPPIKLVKSYPGGSRPAALAERWARRAPAARIEISAGKLVVSGRLEDHELLSAPAPRPVGRTQPAGATQVHTVNVLDKPLGGVLRQIAAQLELELLVDPAAQAETKAALDRRVSFSVREASIDELFEAALSPAGLTFRRDGRRILIRPE
jgi:hypothetical protein